MCDSCGLGMLLCYRLAEKGHHVIGNECVELACRQFFEEHNIPYNTEPIKTIKGPLFKVRHMEWYKSTFTTDLYH